MYEGSFRTNYLKRLSLVRCTEVDDTCLINLLPRNSLFCLEYLNLAECYFITDRLLLYLSENAFKLNTLEICRNQRITDSGISTLLKTCHFIQKLDLEGCVRISDQTLHAIGQNLGSNFKELVVSFCENVSSNGIKFCLSNCQNVERLDLDSCRLLTDEILDFVPDTCNWLGILDCHRISKAAIDNFRTRVPTCKIHGFFSSRDGSPKSDDNSLKDDNNHSERAGNRFQRSATYKSFRRGMKNVQQCCIIC